MPASVVVVVDSRVADAVDVAPRFVVVELVASAAVASIPPLHAVSPLSSLPSPPTSAVSSPRSHLEHMPTGQGQFGGADEDGFDPLMPLDGDGAGNGATGYMFPPASPPPAFPYTQQATAASASSSSFSHDSDLPLPPFGQQPNVRALNENDAALPLSGGSGGGGGMGSAGGSNPFNFGGHQADAVGADKYGDMALFGGDYLDDTLM